MLKWLRRLAQPVFLRAPALRAFALDVLDLIVRPALLPFRLTRPTSDTAAAAAVLANTNELNAAAESYYTNHANEQHVLGKPFSEPEALSRRFIDLGVLIDALRLEPGHVVLELGAGSCWVSHLLNRFGCRTIALDVSPTALELGRRVFRDDPRTNWALDPQFTAYDGHTIPLPSASVDRAIVYDAFHHIPNQAEVLREMRRVLGPDGIVGMSEPGRGHARSESSAAESAQTGVLENELVLEDVADLALAAGFSAARVVIDSNRPLLDIDARDLRRFMGGKGFARYWRNLCAALDGHHYLLLFAGAPQPSTRQPHRLNAVIRPVGPAASTMLSSNSALTLDLYNAGDTTWLASAGAGWTRLGVHLYRADERRTLIDYDWIRMALPFDVAPEHHARVSLRLPPMDEPGDYLLVIDLVIEGVCWFADRGSAPLELRRRAPP